jgi:hypothetical protein
MAEPTRSPAPVPPDETGYTVEQTNINVLRAIGAPTNVGEAAVAQTNANIVGTITRNPVSVPTPPPPPESTAALEANKRLVISNGFNTQVNAARQNANQQAVRQSMEKNPQVGDWRVRLQLAPQSDYLYTAPVDSVGILKPLQNSNGVIFPYTPSISTAYKANYEQYSLIHSNFRGLFYKSSQVDDLQIKARFTAQDTFEANYLLAVIHFFRSVTKMFYGQDPQRGTPPPLVYLRGFGEYQYMNHPCLVSAFTYNLPNDVDYIRAIAPNNYGQSLLNKRAVSQAPFLGNQLAGLRRLVNAVTGGLPKGAQPKPPAPPPLEQNINNTAMATYVPTSMEIDITLIPVQIRSQVSTQFSLKQFANGDLLKGGYW